MTGMVCLELYKIVQGKPVEALKNGFVNLAIPVFAFSEPQAPASTVAKVTKDGEPTDWKWTAWDKLDIQGDLPLKEVIAYMEDNFGLEVSMLSYGVAILYSFFQNPKKKKERMDLPLSKVVELVTGTAPNSGQKYLQFEMMCTDEEGEDVDYFVDLELTAMPQRKEKKKTAVLSPKSSLTSTNGISSEFWV